MLVSIRGARGLQQFRAGRDLRLREQWFPRQFARSGNDLGLINEAKAKLQRQGAHPLADDDNIFLLPQWNLKPLLGQHRRFPLCLEKRAGVVPFPDLC